MGVMRMAVWNLLLLRLLLCYLYLLFHPFCFFCYHHCYWHYFFDFQDYSDHPREKVGKGPFWVVCVLSWVSWPCNLDQVVWWLCQLVDEECVWLPHPLSRWFVQLTSFQFAWWYWKEMYPQFQHLQPHWVFGSEVYSMLMMLEIRKYS